MSQCPFANVLDPDTYADGMPYDKLKELRDAGPIVKMDDPVTGVPYWLVTGRVLEHWHSGSMTQRVPELYRAFPDAIVYMHPDDAKTRNIQEGAMVTVRSRVGEIRVQVHFSENIMPGVRLIFSSRARLSSSINAFQDIRTGMEIPKNCITSAPANSETSRMIAV